jgi:hypothetical protein
LELGASSADSDGLSTIESAGAGLVGFAAAGDGAFCAGLGAPAADGGLADFAAGDWAAGVVFAGAVGFALAAGGFSAGDGAPTEKVWPQDLQRTFFPRSSAGPFNCFLQLGHATTIVAAITIHPLLLPSARALYPMNSDNVG